MAMTEDCDIWWKDSPTTKIVEKVERDYAQFVDTNVQEMDDLTDFNFDSGTDGFWGI